MKNFTLKLAVIVVCMIAALTISCFALSDASTTAIYGTIKLDGQIDAAWEKAHKEDVVLVDTASDLGGYVSVATDTVGVFRTMWDEDYFYVLVEVDKGNLPVSTGFDGRENTDDCVDICVDFTGIFGADRKSQGFPNFGVFRVTSSGEKSGHGSGFDRYQHEYRGKMVKTSDTTYVVEYAFPWPTLDFTLHQESVVALDIQINVADSGKRIGVTNWSSSPATTWDTSTECGTVYLEGLKEKGYPTKAETLPKAKPEAIELFGTIGYTPLDLSDGTEIACRFAVQSGTMKDITISCPSWMDSNGSLTFRLYEWAGDYDTTIANDPIAEYEHVDFADNATLHLANDVDPVTGARVNLGFGEGEYLFWIGNGSDDFGIGVGIYTKDTSANDPRVFETYVDGDINKNIGMMATVTLINAEAIVYPNEPATEDTTAEEVTTEDETTEDVTTEEETSAADSEEETTVADSDEETTVADSEEETTVEDETTAEEGGEVAPPTADYMAIAALAAIACGVVLTLGKKR